MVLKNPQNTFTLVENQILLNNKPLNYSNNIKFLGIIIDKHLNWSEHINNLLIQLRPLSGLLYRCSQYLPYKILILIYNSFINSKLNYGIEAWGNAPTKYINRLYLYQKKVVRILNKKPFDFSTSLLFTNNKLLNIHLIYRFKTLKKAHSFFYTSVNHQHSSVHTRQTLHNLPLPPSTTAAGHRRPRYQEAALWNNLPIDLRLIRDPVAFGRRLKLYLVE